MISVSILNIVNDKKKVEKIESLHPDYIHLDVMDGKFVPEVTSMKTLPQYHSKVDLHLMVEDIDSYLEDYQAYHPEYITFHLEATDNPIKYIDKIHEMGSKVGISIKPNTPVTALRPYLDKIDLVLIMSVEPGYGGQAFLPEAESKIEELFQIREKYAYHYQIEVDGGINQETKKKCEKADILVVGSYITKAENMAEKLRSIR